MKRRTKAQERTLVIGMDIASRYFETRARQTARVSLDQNTLAALLALAAECALNDGQPF